MVEIDFYETFPSPIGTLVLKATENGLSEIKLPNLVDPRESSPRGNRPNQHTRKACLELDSYFQKKRTRFSCALDLKGTPFQLSVWQALQSVPFGSTTTYGDIATRIGNPKSSRAVGNANNRNPIPIIIPCHRIIGRNGKLVGYAGELWRKDWLLNHESLLIFQ